MTLRRATAVARHALVTNLRAPLTRVGLALLIATAGLGSVAGVRHGRGWVLDDGLLLQGFTVAAIFGLRSGLAGHRDTGLQTYLRSNFVAPVEHMAGAILALLGSWLLLVLFTFVLALALSAGDAGHAAWAAWGLLLRSGLLLPFALLVECVSTLAIPFFVPVLGYIILLVLAAMALGVERTVALLATPIDRADPASSLPLALRTGLVLPPGLLLVLAATWLRSRRHAPTNRPRWPWSRPGRR